MHGNLVLVILVASVLFELSDQTSPPYPFSSYEYRVTQNPGTANGYTANHRAGAYWTLQKKSPGNLYPAFSPDNNVQSAPPSGVPIGHVHNDPNSGVESHQERIDAVPDSDDRSLRTTGEHGSCVRMSGFTEAVDICLRNPNQCNRFSYDYSENVTVTTGLSMSLWVSLPHSFDEHYRYIIDTGGNIHGNPGVSIRFKGSHDGRHFTHQIEFIVSTGQKYWRAVLNGMTRANVWNNIAFRWSPDINNFDGYPFGLQVFVNQTSSVWKRAAENTESTTVVGGPFAVSDVRLTVGCGLDGNHSQKGAYDNLAFWYWRLRDGSSDMRADADEQKLEINYFMGGLEFNSTTKVRVDAFTCSANSVDCDKDDWNPWQYMYDKDLFPKDPFHNDYVDDTSPAEHGNCDPQSGEDRDYP